ncbi:CMGC/SRPK protein kinase [Pseudogymnoascus sp. 23342-1-I1]|nr:CMGC/SRPK protein kinase [Pseudogymnoascus sp. 23342-1-I1]
MANIADYIATDTVRSEEKISRYRPGGFHPVSLGNTFKEGRYTVVHKLGYGGFSTVWVAYDDVLHQWVALKIMTAEMTVTSREIRWYDALGECHPDSLSSHYIAQLLDKFTTDGPNGKHLCLIFELLGPNVRTIVKSEYKDRTNIDPETILRMSKQALKALTFVHQRGFAHGDISTKNMAFTAKNLSKVPKEKLFEVIGAPSIENVERIDTQPLADGIPSYLVKSASWGGWVNEYDEDFRLLDFGESFVHGREPEIITQPGGLMPPETVLTEWFDYRVDLWRVGIAIYSFVFGGLPFYCIGDKDNLVIQMIEFIGDLPQDWKPNFDSLRIDFKRQPLLEGDLRVDRGLEYKFKHQIHEEMLQPLLPVIQGLMRFKPDERISAQQALEMLETK